MFIYLNSNAAPKRINFNEEIRLPKYSIANLYPAAKPKSLLNEKGQFFVDVTEKSPYVREFVRQAQDLGLTVSGDGTAEVKGGDIRSANKGNILTIGSSNRFDVNWVKRDEYACKKGMAPVYEIVKDWDKAIKALKQYADQKKNVTLRDGSEVHFHSRFMVADGRVIPYTKDQIMVQMPARILRDLVQEIQLEVRVIRNF